MYFFEHALSSLCLLFVSAKRTSDDPASLPGKLRPQVATKEKLQESKRKAIKMEAMKRGEGAVERIRGTCRLWGNQSSRNIGKYMKLNMR